MPDAAPSFSPALASRNCLGWRMHTSWLPWHVLCFYSDHSSSSTVRARGRKVNKEVTVAAELGSEGCRTKAAAVGMAGMPRTIKETEWMLFDHRSAVPFCQKELYKMLIGQGSQHSNTFCSLQRSWKTRGSGTTCG